MHFNTTSILSITTAALLCCGWAHAQGDCLSWSLGPPAPETGAGPLIAYDSLRNVTVAVFGSGDTFELVNGNWTFAAGEPLIDFPSVNLMPAVTYRSATGQTLLFRFSILWAWNGQVWTPISNSPLSNRVNTAITYDPYRDVVILFGGAVLPGTTNVTNELWEFHAASGVWTQIITVNSPPPRQRASITFDTVRSVAVLFGGNDEGNTLGDTWEYSPSTSEWTERTDPQFPSPPARFLTGMAYHPQLQVIMLSGGRNASLNFIDMWLFDGVRWYERFPDHGIDGSHRGSMAYDSANQVMRQAAYSAGPINHQIIHGPQFTPTITAQPTNKTATVGQPFQFVVQASGDPDAGPLAYQWRHNGVPIPGATLSAYTIFAAEPAHVGAYDCVVTYAGYGDLHCGRTVSIAATLTIEAEPTCLGDLNNSGTVGVSDLLILLGAWGPCP